MMDITGLLSFSNFIFVISVLMICGGLMWLFGIYVLQIIAYMPFEVIELAMYGVLSYLIYITPTFFGPNLGYMWGFMFELGLTGATLITGLRTKSGNTQLFNFTNMLNYAIIGIYLKSSLISAMSVLFLMAFIGFNIGMGSGFVMFGYKQRDIVPSATLASGIVTAIGTYLQLELISHLETGTKLPFFLHNAQLFVPGMLWFPPFVFFLSLLIVSSRLYDLEHNAYIINNIMTIVLSLAAVLLGNLYNITQLTGFSGTFFTLYLAEKYFEVMPNKREYFAWTTFIFGTLLYIVNMHYRSEFETYGLHAYFNIVPPFQGLDIVQ